MLGEVLRRAAGHLEKTSDTARLDAELLLAHALGRSRIELYTDFDRPLNESELAAYRELVARRGRYEPVAYILGEWGFRRLRLKVDRRALIPRPETEIVVERCLERLRDVPSPAVLDVGVGSGAIALALVDELPTVSVRAIDASEEALELARENADRLGLAVELIRHDLRAGLPGGPYDLVVANPPYVAPADFETLMPDVRDWEPRLALVGDDVLDEVAAHALDVLAPGAWVVLEVGDGQAPRVLDLLGSLGYRDGTITRDLAGRERVVEGRR